MSRVAATMPRGGYRTIQGVRALACLLVVAYHGLDQWARSFAPAGPGVGAWPNGSAGVDLFFVISGFVMLLSARRLIGLAGGWHVFMARRLRRIVPLYWAMTLLKLVIALAAPRLTPSTALTGWNVVASLLFLPARDAAGLFRTVLPVGWTLNFEMLFYVVFAIGLACRRPPLQTLLMLLGPLAVLGFFRAPDWPSLLYFANPLVMEFCFGVALAASLPAWPARRVPARAWGALCLAGLVLLMLLVPPDHWRFLVWGVPAAMMVAGAVGLEDSWGAWMPRLVLLLGDASYAIYLVHLFVLPPLALLLRHAGVEGRMALWGLIAGGMVVSAAVGVAVDRWVDRPMQGGHRRVIAI